MLGCDGDRCLAATEHEAEIEWVTGHRLGSGHGWGSRRTVTHKTKSMFGAFGLFIEWL